MAVPTEEIAALAAASVQAVQVGESWDRIVFETLAALCDADSDAVRSVARVSGSFPQRLRHRGAPPPG